MTTPANTPGLSALRRAQAALDRAEREAAEKAIRRNHAMVAAAEKGATRANLQAVTGLSSARITQVLRKTRAALTDQ